MAYGSVLLEADDNRSSRKSRGAFFTPRGLADSIARFAVASKYDAVFEPSCGEAIFLLAAADRLVQLGACPDSVGTQLFGNEIHEESAEAARAKLSAAGVTATVLTGDFFDMEPSEFRFDAIIGNPPYIRYQEFAGAERAKARADALAAGVRIDALASSWAPFVVHAARFLKPGGRLGFVLPAELLTVQYAAPVRAFLLRNFSKIQVTLFEQPVFPEVQEEVVLLYASGFGGGSSSRIYMSQVDSIEELGSNAVFTAPVEPSSRWPIGQNALDAQVFLESLDTEKLARLSDYGSLRLGAVTGSNRFFALSAQEAMDAGLSKSELIPICPPGSRHLRRLSFGDKEFNLLKDSGKRIYLFHPGNTLSAAAQAYIERGEELGIDKAYKCRVRNPWWMVPGLHDCDLFFTYMNGIGPNLCHNKAGVCYLNSIHGLTLNEGMPRDIAELLPVAALSTFTLLSAELVGRSYGGGILKLEPREAGKLLLPAPGLVLGCASKLRQATRPIEEALDEGRRDAATLIVDGILLPELGVTASEAQLAHGALLELRARRHRRSKTRKSDGSEN